MADWITRTIGRLGYRTAQPAATTVRSHLTARGALLVMFAVSLVTCLIAAWLHADVVAGAGFVTAAILAPVYARRDALLHIVISAPVLFLLAEILMQALTAQGSSSRGSVMSVLEGTLLTLADVAPWLFAGTAICAAVAMMRGLPQCIRDLRAGLRGEPMPSTPARSDPRRDDPRRGEVRGASRRR
jgi:hypothetical protein